ncbi:nostrin [Lepeophtheirus salmonis]|uniref:Nostrin n=2 Tax=Lepeophtheirus salmonis TaxID=72036 RepID=A0A0K2SWJ1_LEPSM|nr:uncharacterized protein LOC121120770 [Lepeophtheirus salmonis]
MWMDGSKYYFSDESHVYGGSLGSGGLSMRRSFSLPRWMDQIVHGRMTSTQLSNMVNKPLRRSSLALHRMNSKIKNGGSSSSSSGVSSSSGSSSYASHRSSNNEAAFEEIRTYIKSGSEFTKDLHHILQERSEAENAYAKSLSKLSAKLLKSTRDLGHSSSSVINAWHFIAEDMEFTADIHKSIASILIEECVKPLKTFSDIQHKSRKSIESLVDKRAKLYSETRTLETKYKVKSYSACRDNERVQDQALDCKLGRGKALSEKELSKLHLKRQKAEESARKCDGDYYTSCLKAERSRLDWESGIIRGCSIFRQMEENRLVQLQALSETYQSALSENLPKLVSASKRLQEPIRSSDVERDMDASKAKFELDGNVRCGDSILPDTYAEDATNAMNQERRRQAINEILKRVDMDIEKEKKGRSGVENLAKALTETPKFGGEDSLVDIQEKISHMSSMISYLEACKFKTTNSLNYVDGKTMIVHPYIDNSRKDKSGMKLTLLKLPSNARGFGSLDTIPDSFLTSVQFCDREGSSSGVSEVGSSPTAPHKTTDELVNDRHHHHRHHFHNHHHHDIGDDDIDDEEDVDDDFDSDEDDDYILSRSHHPLDMSGGVNGSSVIPSDSQENEISEFYYQEKQVSSSTMGQCSAIYDYQANLHDELTIFAGDIITIHDKQNDDWWLGEVRGAVGLFPSTYVEIK